MSNPRLAIVTTENLPVFSVPCGGGGVRVWGLAEMLSQHGVDCEFFIPETALPSPLPAKGPTIHPFKPEFLHEDLRRGGFNAALFEQWQPLTFLREDPGVPIAVDLPGPLALEYRWRDPDNYHRHIADKIARLSMADYFVCALERQRGYYHAWLTLAGVPPEEDRLAVVPFCFREMPRASHGQAEDEPVIFWGGVFWPWQDRAKPFETILETLASMRMGQLTVAGDPAAAGPAAPRFDSGHPHGSWIGALPFNEYAGELRKATIAVDLCRPTRERQLASDLRTGTALWAGVPCVVSPASPWAGPILEHNAGWVMEYDDGKSLARLIRSILRGDADLRGKRRGAREISNSISSPARVRPLAEWIAEPVRRVREPHFMDAIAEDRERRLRTLRDEADTLRHQNGALRNELNAIRSKRLFRWYKAAASLLKGR